MQEKLMFYRSYLSYIVYLRFSPLLGKVGVVPRDL